MQRRKVQFRNQLNVGLSIAGHQWSQGTKASGGSTMRPDRFIARGLSRRSMLSALAILPIGLRPISGRAQTDPLPSWKHGATKNAINDFVSRVTVQGGPDFVLPAERI